MLADVPVGSIFKVSLLLVALIVIGWVTVWQVRRRLTSPDETSGAGFSLSDLRQLHKSGQMSDEEFERAKAKVVDAAKRAAERVAEREKAAAGGGLGGSARTAGRPVSDPTLRTPRPPRDLPRPPGDGTGEA